MELGLSGSEHLALTGKPATHRTSKDLVRRYEDALSARLQQQPVEVAAPVPEDAPNPAALTEDVVDDPGPAAGQTTLF